MAEVLLLVGLHICKTTIEQHIEFSNSCFELVLKVGTVTLLEQEEFHGDD